MARHFDNIILLRTKRQDEKKEKNHEINVTRTLSTVTRADCPAACPPAEQPSVMRTISALVSDVNVALYEPHVPIATPLLSAAEGVVGPAMVARSASRP